MRKALFLIFVAVLPLSLSAAVHVSGYTTRSGTYVAPYTRSAPTHHSIPGSTSYGGIPYAPRSLTPAPGYPAAPSYNPYVTPMQPSQPAQPAQPGPSALPAESKPQTLERPEVTMTTKASYDATDPNLESVKQQAQKGFAPSQYSLGVRYLTGNGLPKDEQKGRALLEASADQGYPKAKLKLKELKAAEAEPPKP